MVVIEVKMYLFIIMMLIKRWEYFWVLMYYGVCYKCFNIRSIYYVVFCYNIIKLV